MLEVQDRASIRTLEYVRTYDDVTYVCTYVRTYIRTTARSRPSVSPKAEAKGGVWGWREPPPAFAIPNVYEYEYEQTPLRLDLASLEPRFARRRPNLKKPQISEGRLPPEDVSVWLENL